MAAFISPAATVAAAYSLCLSPPRRSRSPAPINSRVQFLRPILFSSPSPLQSLPVEPRSSGEITLRCSAVTTIGESDFSGEVLGSDVPVLVEFVASWCGPCRLISPVIEWASEV